MESFENLSSLTLQKFILHAEFHKLINTHGLFNRQSLDIGLIYFGIHLDTFGLETFNYRIYLTECSLVRKSNQSC